MSRDEDTQFMRRGSTVQMDYGTVTLGAAGTAVVYTHLNRVDMVIAGHRSALSPSAPHVSARTEADAPYFTITDPAGAVNADAVVNYVAFGK